MNVTEQRVILGTVFFVGILLLVGFVAIKEEARMADFTTFYNSRSLERGATIFESNCSTCHGRQGQGIPGVAPALNNPRLFNGERLAEVGWAGGLRAYVTNAVAAGRPNSGAYWPQAMPTWGQEFGGPLRGDQVDNVVDFVMNWEQVSLDESNPPQVAQEFVLPGGAQGEQGGAAQVNVSGQPAGTDIAAILAALPEGDPVRGDTLYHLTQLACAGCHQNGEVGPITAGTATRVENRITEDPALSGYTLEQYLVESIVAPQAYVVPDYPPAMPPDFGARLDIQDVADLVAFLASQTGQ